MLSANSPHNSSNRLPHRRTALDQPFFPFQQQPFPPHQQTRSCDSERPPSRARLSGRHVKTSHINSTRQHIKTPYQSADRTNPGATRLPGRANQLGQLARGLQARANAFGALTLSAEVHNLRPARAQPECVFQRPARSKQSGRFVPMGRVVEAWGCLTVERGVWIMRNRLSQPWASLAAFGGLQTT